MNCMRIVICLMLSVVGAASAAKLPETPFIRINTDMHSAKIMDIAADSAGALLATASYDKTAKLWEAGSGKLLTTFRPPVGAGIEGALHAVALSPDGTIMAAAGITGSSWDGFFCVYLFDVKTGEITRRLTGFQKSVHRLAFSPDGGRLAIGLNKSGGVQLINLSDGKNQIKDGSLNGNCLGLDFDRQGNLVVATDEGVVRFYQPDGSNAYNLRTENGKQVFGIRFSPDGLLYAIVYNDYHGVEVRKAADGKVDYLLLQPRGKFFSVAWSVDGRYLMAAGGNRAEDGRKLLVKWSVENRELDELIVLPTKDGISQLLPLEGGLVAFVSRMTGFGLLDKESASASMTGRKLKSKQNKQGARTASEGVPVFFHKLSTADFQKNHDLFRISPDALSVYFSYERYGQSPARFDLKSRKLATVKPDDAGLLARRFTADGINIQNWQDSPHPSLNQRLLEDFDSRERSESLTIRHDETGFLLGSNHYLRHYARNGKLLWKKRIPLVAWDIALSQDDKILVAAHDDSTIRWYRMADGKELYALYLHPDRKRWLLWSPDGFFDHGSGSENLIGFQVNRALDRSSIMVGADRMYDLLYRPDVIDRIVAGEDVTTYLNRLKNRPEVVATAKKPLPAELKNKADEKPQQGQTVKEPAEKPSGDSEPQFAGETDDEMLVAKSETLSSLITPAALPPRVKLLTASGDSSTPDTVIKAELCDGGGGIGDITLFLNGMPVVFDLSGRGLSARSKQASDRCRQFERVITLVPGRNVISLMALNGSNRIESERDQVTIRYAAPVVAKPRLHILTIAVNRYRDGDLRLKYSIADAEGVIKAVTEKAATLFSGIETYRLHDEQVTRAGLEDVFAKISAKAGRGDVFVLFMAGHGITDEMDGVYYFLPVDFRYTGLESVARQGISMNDFKRLLSSVQALKTLLLIDTCNSGSFSEGMASRGVTEKTALSKLARSVGRATIAASSKNQVALEGYQGHGVFSYTVLEALKGSAANKKGEITINNLATFIEETLPELTYKKWGYEQIPQKTLIGSDFQIGIK